MSTPQKILQTKLGGTWSALSSVILDATNSLEAAVLFGELCSQYEYYFKNKLLVEDTFYCTHAQLESKLKISAHKIRNAMKVLKSCNLISVTLKKDPLRGSSLNYFKIHTQTMLTLAKKSNGPNKKNEGPLIENLKDPHQNFEAPLIENLKLNNNGVNNNKINIIDETITQYNNRDYSEKFDKFNSSNIKWSKLKDYINENPLISISQKRILSNQFDLINNNKNLSADEVRTKRECLFADVQESIEFTLKK